MLSDGNIFLSKKTIRALWCSPETLLWGKRKYWCSKEKLKMLGQKSSKHNNNWIFRELINFSFWSLHSQLQDCAPGHDRRFHSRPSKEKLTEQCERVDFSPHGWVTFSSLQNICLVEDVCDFVLHFPPMTGTVRGIILMMPQFGTLIWYLKVWKVCDHV